MPADASTSSSFSSSGPSRNPTPQEQLAERRERLKRKAEEDLQASIPRGVGDVNSSEARQIQDIKGKSREVPPAPTQDLASINEQRVPPHPHPALQATDLDLDMLLDGLEIDESIKQMVKDDKIFREDLIRQLMTIPIPGNQNGQIKQGFDLDDSDEEADLGDYELNQNLFCESASFLSPFSCDIS